MGLRVLENTFVYDTKLDAQLCRLVVVEDELERYR